MYKPPGGAYIRRGDLTEGFLHCDFEGLILNFGGAYTWRGLFSEFYGKFQQKTRNKKLTYRKIKTAKINSC